MSKEKGNSRKSYDESILTFNFDVPDAGLRLTEYAKLLLRLQDKDRVFSQNLGYVRWCQGKVLLLARPECKAKGSWSRFLATIDIRPGKTMTPETARLCMRIADQYDKHQARATLYTDMLTGVYDSFKKTLEDDADNDESSLRRSKSRNGGKVPETGPLHHEKFRKTVESILKQSQTLERGCDDPSKYPIEFYSDLLGKVKAIEIHFNGKDGKKGIVARLEDAIEELRDQTRPRTASKVSRDQSRPQTRKAA